MYFKLHVYFIYFNYCKTLLWPQELFHIPDALELNPFCFSPELHLSRLYILRNKVFHLKKSLNFGFAGVFYFIAKNMFGFFRQAKSKEYSIPAPLWNHRIATVLNSSF